MEGQISSFCESLASFLAHVESTITSLTHSIQSRPIPLDSVTSSFLSQINSRASTAGEGLERLESMALGTVSSEELLGHCNEVYKMHQRHIRDLEERLVDFGYVPPPPPAKSFLGAENEEFQAELEEEKNCENGLSMVVPMATGKSKADIFNDSVSLHNFGLSDVCLATLASNAEDNDHVFSENLTQSNGDDMHVKDIFDHSTNTLGTSEKLKDLFVSCGSATSSGIKISKDSYDELASFMKTLASWEDLVEAVSKINSQVCKHNGQNGIISFTENDVEPLGFGKKGRTYLLLLYKMKSLEMETTVGSTSSTVYHVL